MSEVKKVEPRGEREEAMSSSKRLTIAGNIKPMSLEGNLSSNWKKWYQTFIIFLKASAIYEESDARKVAVLLHFIGTESLEIFNSFNLDIDKITFNQLVNKFEEYFVPKRNITYECYKFFTTKQKAEESLEDFLTTLINRSQSCEFGNLQDRMIKDIFITNMHESFQHVREKLLLEEDLTLEKARNLSKTLVSARCHAK
ncbi:uncharacterized protein LOC123664236 [Melitaea cinxia]|uniref:uncharacterized protein LOC123664236 n=1 Tax=Melitaea cinxia TaxID=113334 RepID=UPI001E2739EB|nr:uncharacterized protein LOC123664236 [Melitaea cinxia]